MVERFACCFRLCLLFALLLLPAEAVLANVNALELRVFQVEVDFSQEEDVNSDLLKDFYLNGGTNDGLKEGMLLDVYREKRLQGRLVGDDYRVRILVGQLEIFRLLENVAVARISSLTTSREAPIIQYRTVMVGDYAVPRPSRTKQPAKQLIRSLAPPPAIVLPSEVLFPHDEWTLKAGAKEVLDSVYELFEQAEKEAILVAGHTSSLGSEAYNLELSKKRAKAVADYLIESNKFPQGRVRYQYFGESFPIAANDSEQGRARNRRVTITFLPPD